MNYFYMKLMGFCTQLNLSIQGFFFVTAVRMMHFILILRKYQQYSINLFIMCTLHTCHIASSKQEEKPHCSDGQGSKFKVTANLTNYMFWAGYRQNLKPRTFKTAAKDHHDIKNKPINFQDKIKCQGQNQLHQ